jgi:uncharacterized protein
MKNRILPFYAVMGVFAALAATAAVPVPYLTGRVNDNAGILSEPARLALSDTLKAYEDRTGNQIAVLTVPTLEGEGVEEYAVRVFHEWKLGRADADNGVLILVVPKDRRMRIEVGYGLEGRLTDGTAGQIIRNIMTPPFKNGDYDTGITAGTRAVIAVLGGGRPEGLDDGGKSGGTHIEEPHLPLTQRLLFGAFIFGIIGLFTFLGIVTPGLGWFLYLFLIPFWAVFPIIIVGFKGTLAILATYLAGFPLAKLILKRTAWYKKAQKDMNFKGTTSIGGFTLSSGRSSGSWSSGSSSFSSGSSFSGGGGSSGGGGASGSW